MLELLKMIALLGAIMVMSCAGGKGTMKSTDVTKKEGPSGLDLLQEDFDPMQLVEPPMPIRPKSEEKHEQAAIDNPAENAGRKIPKEVIGYRIQIFQTENAEEARNFQKDALLHLDIDVYLTYDNPYYKVRVGNFETRFEAEEFLATLENKGYKGAWIVRTLIENKDFPKEEQQGEIK